MSYVPLIRTRRESPARQVVTRMPSVVSYGAFAVAFCFTSAVVLGLVP